MHMGRSRYNPTCRRASNADNNVTEDNERLPGCPGSAHFRHPNGNVWQIARPTDVESHGEKE